MRNKRSKLEFTKGNVIMIVLSIIIPLVILGIGKLFPQNPTTWLFFIITVALYAVSILIITKIYIVRKELKDIVDDIISIPNSADDEEKFNLLNSKLEEGKEDKYKYIYNVFYDYKKTFRKIKVETPSGEEKRKLYSTVDTEYFFNEENLIYKNIYYKTISYITQALTGIGIFGTFLGIVNGIGGLNMENTEAMKEGINKLLSGVSVSFNTSLYGILFSLLLTFILKYSIEYTMKNCDEFVNEVNKIVKNSSDKEGLQELEWELKKQTSSLEKLATDLSEEMGKKFDASMQANLSKLTEDMSLFINKIGMNFSNAVMESSVSTSAVLTSNIKPIMESLEITMNNIQKQQENSSIKFIEGSMNAMKEAVQVGTNDEITKLKESMEIISSKNSELVDTFTSSMENMKQLTLHQENLIKNTTTSTESMNVTTENIKDLQENLSIVIQSLNNVSSTNNVSLENIQSTVESLKKSMIEQANTTRIIENMVSKSYDLSLAQDNYIDKFNNISRIMESSLKNTEKYIDTINTGISSYKDKFEFIQSSTIKAIDSIDTRYKSIAKDLDIVNNSLSNTVESVDKNIIVRVNEMSTKLNNLLKELSDYQVKTSMMTNKLEKFADVEESTQDLWMNYRDSFNNLNNTITDGVENYTKNVYKGVNDMLTQYDTSIGKTIESLYKMVETLNETAENMSDSMEEFAGIIQKS
ncbi:hypothetical protein [Terrisporobacter sp.]